MQRVLIMLHGKARSGKNALASALEAYFPPGAVLQAAFADHLKQSAAFLLGAPVDLFYADNKDAISLAPYGLPQFTARTFLQWFGTDVMRAASQGFWLEGLARKLSNLPGSVRYVILTDLRFADEAALPALLPTGSFQCLRVKIIRDVTIADSTHASEQGLPDSLFDIVVDNNGPMEGLKQAALGILSMLPQQGALT